MDSFGLIENQGVNNNNNDSDMDSRGLSETDGGQ